MATIYDRTNGNPIAEGLQGSSVCDEAMQAAKRIANESGHAVLLEDDDGEWTVHPDGRAERYPPTVTGHDAIAIAERHGVTLSKHTDPTEPARTGLTPDQAREIAAEDPWLIYLPAGTTAALMSWLREPKAD